MTYASFLAISEDIFVVADRIAHKLGMCIEGSADPLFELLVSHELTI